MTNCRVCSSRTELYLNKNGYDIYKCLRCGFGQVNVSADDIAEFYDKAYFQGDKANFAQEENSEIPPSHRYWIEERLRLLPKTGTLRILEIGPGVGAPIAGYLQRSYPQIELAAIEISDYAADRLVARGFNVFRGRVTETETLDACRQKYDLIFGTEVIEHDPEPRAFVRAVHDMLKPGGWTAFTTGNLSGGMARRKKQDWYYLDPPAHVSYFTPKSSRHLFGTEDFDSFSAACYGFNYISLKLRTHLPGILLLTHLSKISTGMTISARRCLGATSGR